MQQAFVLQTVAEGHIDGQVIFPPQPSGTEPQGTPVHAVCWFLGVQAAWVPQTLGAPPPPQVWPVGQVPQLSVAPQPLEIEPQFLD